VNEANPKILSVKNLKKKIKQKWIIKGVTFDVHEGEIFGFLGPNGSGKTTTIRMLVDLIKPTEGSITICGKDVHREHDEAMRYVGSIVENPELYTYLTGWENLEHFAGMLPQVDAERIHEVVATVGMDQRIHDVVKTYSLGMRQRLGIAQALLGRPKLLILDEPTNGLDPQGIKEMRDFIRLLADQGLSLFISSHLLSEIQMMCDRVAIIRKGEVIAVGRVDELLEQPFNTVLWKVDSVNKAAGIMRTEPKVEILSESSSVLELQMKEEDIPGMNRLLVENEVEIFSIEIKKPTLEDLFLNLTEGERID
jgi:ABC-2 type transport system ATP-binding protein